VSSADEFLGLLGDEDRAELERIGHRRQADRPDVLLARGDEADRVLVLEAGRVKVTVPTASGTDAVLTFRGPGALLGEQALVEGGPDAGGDGAQRTSQGPQGDPHPSGVP